MTLRRSTPSLPSDPDAASRTGAVPAACPGAGVQAPRIAAPRQFVERRVHFRWAADRLAHQEAVLLARALDVLAEDRPAEERLAELLELLARTVGAQRAAVVADGVERRIAVGVSAGETTDAAEALAAWLDAAAPRSRAARVAASPASIAIVSSGRHSGRPRPHPQAHFCVLPIDRSGDVALGFTFRSARGARQAAEKLPAALGRHAAVALALVTAQVAEQRELAALRAQEARRNTFISTVAHELRTPLAALGGYLDLILEEKVADPGDRREFLARSRTMVDGLAGLVGDLLELSRIESGSLNLDARPFSAAETAQRVMDALMPIALQREIELVGALPSRLRTVVADRRRVEQVLTNLAGNAVKFTATGGRVEIALTYDGPVALYAVRDDGQGIAPEDRIRIFDRFYRIAGHEEVPGTGLGLSIARELARAMGGELEAASSVGRGSTFVLALPALTGIDGQTVAAALRRALAAEERALTSRPRPLPLRLLGKVAADRPSAAVRPASARRSDSRPALPLHPSGSAIRDLGTRRVHAVDGALAIAE